MVAVDLPVVVATVGAVGTLIGVALAYRLEGKSNRELADERSGQIQSTKDALKKAYDLADFQRDMDIGRALIADTKSNLADINAAIRESRDETAEFQEASREVLASLVTDLLRARPKNPNEFLGFWGDTQKQLASYHREARTQLKYAHILAQAAGSLGFILVLALGIAAASADTTSQAIAAATVGSVGAALAAFTSRTFNSTYTKALARSSAFFHEPVVASRLLAAERLLAEYAEEDGLERAKAITAMITAAVDFQLGQIPSVEYPAEPG